MDGGSIYLGIPLARIAGIEVRLHWTLLILWALRFQTDAPFTSALGMGLMFLSILLHEFGHCFAARRVGGDADEILMWPLGGLAFCHCPDYWKSHLIVAAGGPLVTVAIIAVSYPAAWLINKYLPGVAATPWFYETSYYLCDWNLLILIFNLIPAYPLDGGRIFHALAWGYFERQGGFVWGGRSRASRVTLQLARAMALVGIAYAVYTENWQFLVLVFFVWSGSEQLGRGG